MWRLYVRVAKATCQSYSAMEKTIAAAQLDLFDFEKTVRYRLIAFCFARCLTTFIVAV